MRINKVGAGAVIGWLAAGWRLFIANPAIWIVNVIIYLVIAIVLGFIPIIGGLALTVINPAFGAGLLAGARSLDGGGTLGVEHLFAGFTDPRARNPLLVLGGLLVAATIALVLIAMLVLGGSIFSAAGGADAAAAGIGVFGALVMLALGALLAMAFLYAPALVMFEALAPVAAVQLSFRACLANLPALVLLWVICVVLGILAAIPFGLGLLVLAPVLIGTVWTSYKAIFGAGPQAPAAA